tara:strand:+ start:252 stop:734 length:483 start_codon:yes stop_codon:yes gene_type:complete
MAYTWVLNRAYSDDEFDRLMNDSMPSMLSTFSGSTEETNTRFIKRVFENSEFIASTLEDGYLLSMSSGNVRGDTVTWSGAIYGKNEAGSHSYIYSSDWIDGGAAFVKEQNLKKQINTYSNNSGNMAVAQKNIHTSISLSVTEEAKDYLGRSYTEYTADIG